jgi:hypothetical protein
MNPDRATRGFEPSGRREIASLASALRRGDRVEGLDREPGVDEMASGGSWRNPAEDAGSSTGCKLRELVQ